MQKKIEEDLTTKAKEIMATNKDFKTRTTIAEKEAFLKTALGEDITDDEKTHLDKVIKSLNLGEGKASDKNASIFSKTRWSSIAEGLAKR